MTDSCWYKSKRMRVDDGCNNNTNVATKDSKQWTYSGDTSLVEPEILEDMGVSMLADGESSQENKIPLLKTQECTISPKKFDKNKIRKSENALKKKENYSFDSNTANRLDPLEEVTNNKELNLGDEAISFSTINNESGYLSRIDSGNFSDSKENLNKEDSNDALDKQELDQFFLNRRKKRPSIMGEDRFNKLSDEIVLLILKFLSKKCLVRSMLVCKRWCQIAKDEVLWTRLDLGGKVLNQGTLGYIIPRGVQILRLAQAEIAEPTFIDIPNEIYDNEPCKLQYLDLSMAVISVNDLSQLLSKCKYLKKLSLEKCTLDKSCCEAISQNSDLEALNLTMCDGLDISCVEDLIKLKRLDCLNMAWCGLDLESMSLLCKSLTSRINRLNIAGCRKTLLDENVMDLVSSCPDLVELDLSDCTSLTINVVNNLMTLSKLEHLSLSRCYSIPTMMFAKLTLMPRLRYLDIFGLMPDEMIKSFQAKCDSIEINKYLYSAIARPTVGVRRTSIWNLRVRD